MNSGFDLLINFRASRGGKASPLCDEIFGESECRAAYRVISKWTGYEPTPLVPLSALAAELQLASIHYKDESSRFGLKSFKALGGAYAVFRVLADYIKNVTGATVDAEDLLSGKFRGITENVTVASATAGNHGRSVAWGAQMFGCHCKIYIHRGVSETRADAIAQYGAEIIRVDGNYDDSVNAAAQAARDNRWIIVSDTSYEGYTEIPKTVMQGYTVMLQEIVDQSGGVAPTHILVQGGVGGLAAAVAGYFQRMFKNDRPTLIVVEPVQADCLYQSARHGSPAPAAGNLDTLMLGMACGEVSLLAWQILAHCADAYVRLQDEDVLAAVRYLNRTAFDGQTLVAGECSGAGLAALRHIAADENFRKSVGLSSQSRVLIFGTEGDTDPQSWARIMQTQDTESGEGGL